MTLFLNMAATLFFLAMLAFGVGLCFSMLRRDGARMLAAFAGQEFAPSASRIADGRQMGAQKASVSGVNLSANPPQIENSTPWALAA